ncbi:hypothetical protein [Paenibacillus roseipurpureus]|uniref:Uncharacterized protein n=1 Tax=Paenibacillus roseopurpureus TaxID=2918901 RepID=A0AA96LUP6_9BACL|nr:hypothetical protein [Paenibacillus sp. MBLB1832]WNR44980.1 hypothetical protein MJB10_02165 [Paenibacillus sp. MBLB1832]
MKKISKKILAGSLVASFVIGVGLVGALHNEAFADTAAGTSTSTTAPKADKAGKGFGDRGRGPMGDHAGFRGGNIIKETATILGIEESAVQDALKADKTLADLAVEKGLTKEDFLQKLVAAETTAITADVTAGKLTQEKADEIIKGLSDHISKEIEGTGFKGGFPRGGKGGPGGPGGQGGPGGHGGFGGGMFGNPEAVSTILGITPEGLRTELEAGKSIVDVAAAKGISEDDLISKIKDSMTDGIKKSIETKGTDRKRPDGGQGRPGRQAPGSQATTPAPAPTATN